MNRSASGPVAGLAAALLLLTSACAPLPGGPMGRGPEPGHRPPGHEQQAPPEQRPASPETGQESAQGEQQTATVAVRNPNGSWTPVTLTQLPTGQWRGPAGETYLSLPPEEQLRPLYGLK